MIDSEGANHDQKKEPRNERRVDVEFEHSPTKRLIDPSTGVSNDVATSSGTIPRFFEERSSIHIYIYIYIYIPFFLPSRATASLPPPSTSFLRLLSPETSWPSPAMHCAPVNYVRINAESYRIQFERFFFHRSRSGAPSAAVDSRKNRRPGRGYNTNRLEVRKRGSRLVRYGLKLFSLFPRFVRVCNTVAKLLVA